MSRAIKIVKKVFNLCKQLQYTLVQPTCNLVSKNCIFVTCFLI